MYELSPGTSGTWSYQVIYTFTGFHNTGDGAEPIGRVTFDSNGNLYGTTAEGGTNQQGTVYELTPASNGTWTEKILHSFSGPDGAGLYVSQGVIVDPAGNLYGTTGGGGAFGQGVVFQLVPGTNGTWTENILHSFTGGNDGGLPFARLIRDSAGHLFGTAFAGPHDYGILFEMIQGTNGSWSERVIYAFTGGAGGAAPEGKLAFGPRENFMLRLVSRSLNSLPSTAYGPLRISMNSPVVPTGQGRRVGSCSTRLATYTE